MPLRLEGSVSFTVDGPRGPSAGTARGDGPVLRVRADDPGAAWEGVRSAVPGGASIGQLADLLDGEGLSLEVSGPDGVLTTLGAGADSALGRVVTGSRRVQLGGLVAVRPLVGPELRRLLRTRRRELLVVAVVTVLSARRRWRSH